MDDPDSRGLEYTNPNELSAFDDVIASRRRSLSIRSKRSPVATKREYEAAKKQALQRQNREEREKLHKEKAERLKFFEKENQDRRTKLLDQSTSASTTRENHLPADPGLKAHHEQSLPCLVIDGSHVDESTKEESSGPEDQNDNNKSLNESTINLIGKVTEKRSASLSGPRLRSMSTVAPGDRIKRSTTNTDRGISSNPSRRSRLLERSKTTRLLRSFTQRGASLDPQSSPSQRRRAVGNVERRRQPPNLVRTELAGADEGSQDSTALCCNDWWTYTVWGFTWWIPPLCLRRCGGMHDKPTQWAWREKTTLCMIIGMCCIGLAFFTFAFQYVSCGLSANMPRMKRGQVLDGVDDEVYEVRGNLYRLPTERHEFARALPKGTDISAMFVPDLIDCKGTSFEEYAWSCTINAFPGQPYCHVNLDEAVGLVGQIEYGWEEVKASSNLLVYNGYILDTNVVLSDPILRNRDREVTNFLEAGLTRPSRDVSLFWHSNPQAGRCISHLLRVGHVDAKTFGCLFSDLVLIVSLTVIIGLVLIRFILATYFSWFISRELGRMRFRKRRRGVRGRRRSSRKNAEGEVWGQVMKGDSGKRGYLLPGGQDLMDVEVASWREGVNRSMKSGFLDAEQGHSFRDVSSQADLVEDWPGKEGSFISDSVQKTSRPSGQSSPRAPDSTQGDDDDTASIYSLSTDFNPNVRTIDPLYTVVLVTCYSEEQSGIRTTLDSVAMTDFPDKYKLIFVVADGLITGSGQSKSTPECILELMHFDEACQPEPKDYVAIGTGDKARNMAKVYAGHYKTVDTEGITHKVAMITVVKCGTPAEGAGPKPGNRGKRDSQVLLMDFFSKVLLDDPLSPLQFELLCQVFRLTRATADKFEIVLMVDADTKVMTDSLTRLVLCMARDPEIMGLCGETRIANKSSSWVSAIQVFEYHISHHLAKSFESIFGGVTCLPGCFCCYRIKSPKRGFWALILANPYIIQQYSASTVDTLHRKNLLLLGEDRFLTTLMLQAFPRRKMMFVPKAVCKTDVPDSFKVLLSQRRRWINSTVHNLLELVLVRELCGTFCFSMQFVVAVELFGTVVLPAAITFTFYLLVIAFVAENVPWIPLFLLFAILGLPAVLIMITSAKVVYIQWMIVYLLALPVWNFILPVYAYWHFDDFSWGKTREVAGDGTGGGDGHGTGSGSSAEAIAAVPVLHFLQWMSKCLPQSKHTKKFNEIIELETTEMTRVAKIDPILSKERSREALKPSGSAVSLNSLWSSKKTKPSPSSPSISSPVPRHANAHLLLPSTPTSLAPSPSSYHLRSSQSHHNFDYANDSLLAAPERRRVLGAASRSDLGHAWDDEEDGDGREVGYEEVPL